jgi:hypothetical protein
VKTSRTTLGANLLISTDTTTPNGERWLSHINRWSLDAGSLGRNSAQFLDENSSEVRRGECHSECHCGENIGKRRQRDATPGSSWKTPNRAGSKTWMETRVSIGFAEIAFPCHFGEIAREFSVFFKSRILAATARPTR